MPASAIPAAARLRKHPDAPIFHYCDYGLVADMDETCDALLRAME